MQTVTPSTKLTPAILKELLRLAETGKLQRRNHRGFGDDKWHDTGEVYRFDFQNSEYRERPEPIEAFACLDKGWLIASGRLPHGVQDDIIGVVFKSVGYIDSPSWRRITIPPYKS